MAVTVKIPTQLRAATGGEAELEVEGGTVGEVLDAVFDAHGGLRDRITQDGDLRRFVNVYVSGEDIRFQQGLETSINDGDEVTILPAGSRRLIVTGAEPRSAKPFTPPDDRYPSSSSAEAAGTRLRERTESVPKALVEIGGRPILWHVIQIYAAQGFDRFLLATGYMGEAVAEFAAAERWPEGVEVEAIDTGLDTPTGGRVAALGERLGGERFCVTYADGVADVDLGGAARLPRRPRCAGDRDRRPAEPPVGSGRARRRPRRRLRREAAQRALDQRRLLLLRAGRARLPRRRQRARARAARAPGRRRSAAGLPPRGLLGLHGHLQGRGRPQRPLGGRRAPWRIWDAATVEAP